MDVQLRTAICIHAHQDRIIAMELTDKLELSVFDFEKAFAQARASGALELPGPVRGAMRAAAKVMTTTAHYV